MLKSFKEMLVNQSVLIIGGSEAGLQAALDLADSGVDVHLVERSAFMGLNHSARSSRHQFHTKMLETTRHPRITLWNDTDVDDIAGFTGNYQIRLRQNPRFVDLARCTACGDCLEVCPVAVPGKNRKAIYIDDEGVPGCAAIDKIGRAPCSNACPGGIHVQGYVALIAEGRFQEALDLIREAIPFPAICGRICTHPCEINCRRNEIDTPVSIRLLKRFVSDWEESGSVKPPTFDWTKSKPQNSVKKIAVIGAGPAGMTAASYLCSRGYPVTVFEKMPVIGGMLAVGIPAYRLPRDVIAREYDVIRQQGVEIQLNTSIGSQGDRTLEDLVTDGYAAVCLTVGAHESLSLGIPGEGLTNVIHGIDLLKQVSLSQQTNDPDGRKSMQSLLPKGSRTRVAVLGGGNTAMDVSRTLRRLGLSDVRILYRRSRAEMPALAEEISETENEGVQIQLLTAPKAIKGNEKGFVTGIECMRMELGAPDLSGRRRPVPLQGSEFDLDLDLVVLAIGQAPDLDFINRDTGVTVGNDWRIQVDEQSYMTGRAGVFAAGDAITRTKMSAIEAIGMGKKMARAVDLFLQGKKAESKAEDLSSMSVANRELTPEEQIVVPKVPVPVLPIEKRLQGFAEVERGYSQEDAIKEARRCLQCGPCSECLACVRICKAEALNHIQTAKHIDLNVGMVICADDPEIVYNNLSNIPQDILTTPPNDSVGGSAAAARIETDQVFETVAQRSLDQLPVSKPDSRTAVYICRCGDDMGGAIRTQTIQERIQEHAQVEHTDILAYACGMEAATQVKQDIVAYGLDRVVLAACSCCSSDQVCFSCTYQRVRCKENLGMYQPVTGFSGGTAHSPVPGPIFEFVNIREQCAWVHMDNPTAATSKALILIEGAISRITESAIEPGESLHRDRSVIVLGHGRASQSCLEALLNSGMRAVHLPGLSSPIDYKSGFYTTRRNGHLLQALSIIITPKDVSEADQILRGLNVNESGAGISYRIGQIETTRPGVFLCDPELEQGLAGQAVAARCRGWMGRNQNDTFRTSAKVDPNRCRMCYTCMGICETGAPRAAGQDFNRHVWVDPVLCTGCGACVACCPSNAIRTWGATDRQMEIMITNMLSLEKVGRGV
jgi:NADPH-dependent glutamate synthase beta subunit-like oxidoreductase/Pyruvate/2-oxoacid:ferredoxin oxidoreductase delta subunit